MFIQIAATTILIVYHALALILSIVVFRRLRKVRTWEDFLNVMLYGFKHLTILVCPTIVIIAILNRLAQ
jgi:hypothetical protein